jgi:hypothetical protein
MRCIGPPVGGAAALLEASAGAPDVVGLLLV